MILELLINAGFDRLRAELYQAIAGHPAGWLTIIAEQYGKHGVQGLAQDCNHILDRWFRLRVGNLLHDINGETGQLLAPLLKGKILADHKQGVLSIPDLLQQSFKQKPILLIEGSEAISVEIGTVDAAIVKVLKIVMVLQQPLPIENRLAMRGIKNYKVFELEAKGFAFRQQANQAWQGCNPPIKRVGLLAFEHPAQMPGRSTAWSSRNHRVKMSGDQLGNPIEIGRRCIQQSGMSYGGCEPCTSEWRGLLVQRIQGPTLQQELATAIDLLIVSAKNLAEAIDRMNRVFHLIIKLKIEIIEQQETTRCYQAMRVHGILNDNARLVGSIHIDHVKTLCRQLWQDLLGWPTSFVNLCAMATSGDIGIEQLLHVQSESGDKGVFRAALPGVHTGDAASALADHMI